MTPRPARVRAAATGGGAACLALLAVACDGSNGGAWSGQMGGPGTQVPRALAANEDGIVIGALYGDAFSVGDRQLGIGGGVDAAVVAVDATGRPRWAHELAGRGNDFITAVAAGPGGDIYVAGAATGGAVFAGREIAAPDGAATLVARLRADGTLAWLATSRDSGFQRATALAVGADGSVYVAGDFTSTLDLGSGGIAATDGGDAFVARYSAAGELLWLRAISGAGVQHASALAMEPTGDLFMVGSYRGTLLVAERELAGNPLADLTPFAARFEEDGTLAWVQHEIVPAVLNHIEHPEGHDAEHPPVRIRDVVLAAAPSGTLTTAVSYGILTNASTHDAVPQIDSLVVTSLTADGAVLGRKSMATPQAALELGGVMVAEEGSVSLAISWAGVLPELSGGPTFASGGDWSLGLLTLSAEGQFAAEGTLSRAGVDLREPTAVRLPDGTVTVAASGLTQSSQDRNIVFARFD